MMAKIPVANICIEHTCNITHLNRKTNPPRSLIEYYKARVRHSLATNCQRQQLMKLKMREIYLRIT